MYFVVIKFSVETEPEKQVGVVEKTKGE